MARRVAAFLVLALGLTATANAEDAPPAAKVGIAAEGAQSQAPSPAPGPETRPATTTFFGDTGLWFMPTAEILPDGKWSVSGYRYHPGVRVYVPPPPPPPPPARQLRLRPLCTTSR